MDYEAKQVRVLKKGLTRTVFVLQETARGLIVSRYSRESERMLQALKVAAER